MNPLTDLIPAKYRMYLYAVAAAGLFVYSLWKASDGDWSAFAVALVGALAPALAASNTNKGQDAVDDGHFLDGHNEL